MRVLLGLCQLFRCGPFSKYAPPTPSAPRRPRWPNTMRAPRHPGLSAGGPGPSNKQYVHIYIHMCTYTNAKSIP